MKKIAFLLLFGFLATTGFAQLEVAVSHDGQNMDVQFPAGSFVEYKVALVDPINPGSVELQSGRLDANSAELSVKWAADLRYIYEVSYRYQLATGEISEWYTIDPKALLNSEGK
ncbi:MAG: hypothetical protein IPP17_11485 [Bacteroidetes bacterium]|nr:hypothetical protein [Bacteroidota bacterium]